MGSYGSMRPLKVLDDLKQMKMVIELRSLAWILAYMDENRIKATLEANSQQKVVVEATTIETCETDKVVEDTVSNS